MIFLTETFEKLRLRLCAVTVFKGVTQSEVLSCFLRLLESICQNSPDDRKVSLYAEFTAALYAHGCDLGEYLKTCICEDENIYITLAAAKKPVLKVISDCALAELELFSSISAIDRSALKKAVLKEGELPDFLSTPYDFSDIYAKRVKNADKKGYGIFARHTMFRVEKGEILPFESPDEIRLDSLFGYESERKKVLDNTKALLEGKPAANVLLFGDAGTGKSSTVKAVTNQLASEGLRLIELSKAQLPELPRVCGKIRENPLKFIIFIDDLSFNKNDDSLGTLKAILEGSASAKSENAVIYATSNRRHLVKESMSDRSGDDLHAADTRQELMSLAARFGLTVTFQQPDKDRYDTILLELAKQYGVQMPSDQLFIKGQAFALRAGGRSPRVAKQFVELLAAGVNV